MKFFKVQAKLPSHVEAQNTKELGLRRNCTLFQKRFNLVHLKAPFLKQFDTKMKRPQLHYNITFSGVQMLEYIGLVPNNNCVISRQTLLNSFRRDVTRTERIELNGEVSTSFSIKVVVSRKNSLFYYILTRTFCSFQLINNAPAH